jgi:hypothetical protein
MSSYIQETDSKVVFPYRPEISFSSAVEPKDETLGSRISSQFLSLPVDHNVTRAAWKVLWQTENQEIANEARRVLEFIQETIATFQHLRFDLGYLPELHAFKVDDGSILIEWIFDDFRIGFSIEPDVQESSWYLVSSKNLGEISASGYIQMAEIKNLIIWIINFVISHS